MRIPVQSQNEGTPAVSQAPGNQRLNNICCFRWCCCFSCSCLTVRNEERGENAGITTHTMKTESIQVLEECQNPTAEEVLPWSQNFDKMMKAPFACEDLKKEQNKKKARMINEDYISILSPKEVSLDSRVINRNLLDPNPYRYSPLQPQVTLLQKYSFKRFLNFLKLVDI
uniref:Uncharacterized protein n=1 Tax=Colobus angolensis palliatus TaxID=336983 RepID=A0A2K5IMH2_COLAP